MTRAAGGTLVGPEAVAEAVSNGHQRAGARSTLLRPNILVAGVNGLAEREWPGRRARIGEATIGFKKLRGRCVMTTYDPDTLEHDPTVLRRIVREMGGRLALDSYVVRAGELPSGIRWNCCNEGDSSAGNRSVRGGWRLVGWEGAVAFDDRLLHP